MAVGTPASPPREQVYISLPCNIMQACTHNCRAWPNHEDLCLRAVGSRALGDAVELPHRCRQEHSETAGDRGDRVGWPEHGEVLVEGKRMRTRFGWNIVRTGIEQKGGIAKNLPLKDFPKNYPICTWNFLRVFFLICGVKNILWSHSLMFESADDSLVV